MGKLWQWVVAAFAWSEADKQDWRSWLMHSAIALVLAALFSPATALGIYGWRELEQASNYKRAGKSIPYTDCLLDFWSPFMAVAAAVAFVLGDALVGSVCLGFIGIGLAILWHYKRFVRVEGK